jgi:predicted metal-dependent peptidase
MSTDLEGKLLKAKVELMTRSAFISTIALSMRHVITDATKTADVNGTTIRYNPEFLKKQTVTQFAGLMAHECWHVAFQHLARRGSRDSIIWNCAGDYIINSMLTKAGFEIPTGGLLNKKYDSDSEWSTDKIYEDLIKENYDPDTGTLMLDLREEEGDEKDGVARDSAVTNIIVRARTQAQMSGKQAIGEIPSEILRIIDELLNPKLPWPVILHKFLDQRVREEYSWARKNRRYPKDTYMPSLHSYGLGHLTFAIDTSGSIEDNQLQEMLSEIKGIQQTFNPESMTVIDCDSAIHQVYEINQTTDILSLEFAGGGGTSFTPVLNYVKKHPTQALVYFTDLYGESELDPVDYPILWICNSDHEPATIGETVYVDHYSTIM